MSTAIVSRQFHNFLHVFYINIHRQINQYLMCIYCTFYYYPLYTTTLIEKNNESDSQIRAQPAVLKFRNAHIDEHKLILRVVSKIKMHIGIFRQLL